MKGILASFKMNFLRGTPPQSSTSLYYEPLAWFMINSTIKLYADNVLIYRIIDSENDYLALQNDIDKLEQWADVWSMKFNPDKCVHLKITNTKTSLNHNYTIYNHQLREVTSAKYLGITIDKRLTWKDHVNEICSKANSAKTLLRRNIYQCPKTIKSNCYKSFVQPILEYAAPVWSPFLYLFIYFFNFIFFPGWMDCFCLPPPAQREHVLDN